MYGWEKPFSALVDEVRRYVSPLCICLQYKVAKLSMQESTKMFRMLCYDDLPALSHFCNISFIIRYNKALYRKSPFLFCRMEISKIMKSSYLRGMNMASFFVASKIIIFITVCVYVLMGNELSASRVFMAMSLYGAVRLTITLFFPCAIEKVSESLISIRRIKVNTAKTDRFLFFYDQCENWSRSCVSSSKEFLLLDEVSLQHHALPVPEKKDCLVKIQDLRCYWDQVRGAVVMASIYTPQATIFNGSEASGTNL